MVSTITTATKTDEWGCPDQFKNCEPTWWGLGGSFRVIFGLAFGDRAATTSLVVQWTRREN